MYRSASVSAERTGDAAAHLQTGSSGVHERVRALFGDIASDLVEVMRDVSVDGPPTVQGGSRP